MCKLAVKLCLLISLAGYSCSVLLQVSSTTKLLQLPCLATVTAGTDSLVLCLAKMYMLLLWMSGEDFDKFRRVSSSRFLSRVHRYS